jgi:hypothetical protein
VHQGCRALDPPPIKKKKKTYARCRIDTINSPDDGHVVARNMLRIEINIHEKELCIKFVICKDYIEMRGQQNIKCVCMIVCPHISRLKPLERC